MPAPSSDDEGPAITVRSGVALDGTYTCEVSYFADIARILSPAEIAPYADTLDTAAMMAEYDAAVLRQMREKVKLPINLAAQLINNLRGARPELDRQATFPLRVTPSVSVLTGKPFLLVAVEGVAGEWQWDPADAEHHASGVRQATIVADMDAAYRRVLVGNIGIDDDVARGIVDDLGNWRHPRQDDTQCRCH